ncbi:MAG: polyamine aminopropyltransferase [Candidatus Aenigmarchaeota archaeon]|nr:polyamine aminopropyltransferase [Candidatus Aenigmarchaeota archaeon]
MVKWFCEKDVPGKRKGNQKVMLRIEKVVFKGKTKYQKVFIFDNAMYGRILTLDGIIEFSEADEFIYHEMIVHPLMFSLKKPERILIIGGGDGGALREVLKHSVKKVDVVEMDPQIIEISKKYLKFVSKGSFKDERVEVFEGRGEEFLKECEGVYDGIIVDSTGPNEYGRPLLSKRFYSIASKALKKGGILSTLVSSFIDFNEIIKPTYRNAKKFFKYVTLMRVTIPSYNCGEYCFMLMSNSVNVEKPSIRMLERKFEKFNAKESLKFYTPKVHVASLILPPIWRI